MSLKEHLQMKEIIPSLEDAVKKDIFNTVLPRRSEKKKKFLAFTATVITSIFVISYMALKNNDVYVITHNQQNAPTVQTVSIVDTDDVFLKQMVKESATQNMQHQEAIEAFDAKLNNAGIVYNKDEAQRQAAIDKHQKEVEQYIEMAHTLLPK